MDAGPTAYRERGPRAVSLSSPARKLLARESRYLVWGLLFGLVSVPSIGTVYYREDIAIGYRQFLGGLFDREIWFIAVAYSALDEIHQSFVASRGASASESTKSILVCSRSTRATFTVSRSARRQVRPLRSPTSAWWIGSK